MSNPDLRAPGVRFKRAVAASKDIPMPLPSNYQHRRERGATHLHALGPRAVCELLSEVAGTIGGLPRRLAAYERVTPGMVRAAADDRFPQRPLHLVASR